jgi:methyl-accepting chemotaxis protein
MKTIKIGTRLAIGLVALSAITATFGAFAYLNTANVDQVNNHLRSVALPAAYLSEDLRNGVQRQYTLLQQFLNSTEPGRRNGLDAALTSERSRNADLLAKFQTLPLNDNLRRLVDSLKSAREGYTSSSEAALNLARTGSEESRETALGMEAQQVRAAYAKYLRSADALVMVTRSATVEADAGSDAFSTAAPGDTLAYLAFALVLSGGISVLLFFNIARPLARGLKAFRQFSSGHLGYRAEVKSDDELGQMLAGLNWQLDNQSNAVKMATRLADGDFLTPQTGVPEEDVLGQAILRLRRSVQASYELTERILAGDLTSRFRPIPAEEKLAHSLYRIRERLRNSTEVAKQIAKYDFSSEMAAPEAGDVLGETLVRMRENLKASEQLAARLSTGDLVLEGLPLGRDAMSRSLVRVRENLLASAQVMERVSEGDLSVQAAPLGKNDALGNAMARMLETLRRVLRAALSSASSVASAGSEILVGAEQLWRGSCEHAAASAESAAALGVAAASLQMNIETSLESDRLAAAVGRDGELGTEAVGRALGVIREVAEKVSEMDEIARKTDMLTLAAAIEAARAGEQGLGFSVVAGELRKLGERNAAIAAEIVRIGGGAVKAGDSAAELLGNLVTGVSRTGELMRQVASFGAEQSAGLTQADRVVQQLDSVLHENVLTTQRMSALADQLMTKAKALESGIGFFHLAEGGQAETGVVPEAPAILQNAAGA